MNKGKLKKRSEEYFDSLAKTDYNIEEPKRCYSILSDNIGSDAKSVLDVGCGTGTFLGILSERLSEKAVLTGIDLSAEMINLARKTVERARFYQGDAENLPFESNSFEVVTCSHSFHHYPEPQKAMNEFFRVTASSGTLYVVENDASFFRRMRSNILLWLRRHPNGDICTYSQAQLIRFAEKAGFQAITCTAITPNSCLLTAHKAGK